MKHLSTLFTVFATILFSAVSCTREIADSAPVLPVPDADGYAVSVDDALRALDNELSILYDEDETRTSPRRRYVRNISSIGLGDIVPATRSVDIPDDVEDLLYVVEFADGCGSAVLGADKRVESVLAVLDETVLTAEDFTALASEADADDLRSFVVSLIANGAVVQAATAMSGDPIDLIGDRPLPIYIVSGPETETYDICRQKPLLQTKWDQDSPYNDAYEMAANGEPHPAGCGVIAIAQIMMFHQFPDPLNVNNGYIFEWEILNRFKYGCSGQTAADRTHLSQFVYQLKNMIGATYSDSGTGTTNQQAVKAFANMGYHSIWLQSLSYDVAKNFVYSQKKPFYISGFRSGGSGHAWVIDGWNSYSMNHWLVTYDTRFKPGDGKIGRELSRELVGRSEVNKVHCNFGWDGICDGYYSFGVFDLSKRYVRDLDESVGDRESYADRIYDTNLKMITCLPNN